jgi:hypothetical protein
MEKLTRIEVCCGGCEPKCGKCGEIQVIELTDAEVAQREIDIAAAEARRAEELAAETAKVAAKESAKAKLAALGLTPEEIAAL